MKGAHLAKGLGVDTQKVGGRPLCPCQRGSPGREGLSSWQWLGSLGGQGYDTGGVLGDP